MTDKFIKWLIFAVAVTALFSCSRSGKTDNAVPEPVAPLWSVMRDYNSYEPTLRDSVFVVYEPEFKAFMKTVSDDSLSEVLVSAWSASLPVEIFTPAVDSVYPSVEDIEWLLGNILGRASDAGIEFPRRRYAAVVYGRPESILFVDSVMLIALNHYLGVDYPGYSHWPVYRRLSKTPQNLPYDIAEALVATSYPYTAEGEDATLLSGMLYQGALVAAKMELVGSEANLAEALGYSTAELERLEGMESEIWRTIVGEKMLYDTSESMADRMLSTAPAVRVSGNMWPPRVGRFIGYKIIKAYQEKHPDTPLEELLAPDFYLSPSALADAGY